MSIAIDNERTKLTASAIDRASTACLAIGVFAPLSGLLGAHEPLPVALTAMTFAGWIATAIVLRFAARRMLGGLRQ